MIAPVAWLRLEPTPVAYVPAELRLTVWDGREAEPADRLLATSGFHGGEPDDDRCAAARGMGQDQRRRSVFADSVEGVVDAARRGLLQHRRKCLGWNRMRSAELGRAISSRVDRIGDDDHLGPRDAGSLDAELADAAGPDDQHRAA